MELAWTSLVGTKTLRLSRVHRASRQCLRKPAQWHCKIVRAAVPVRVEAPRGFVFDLFSDLEKMPEWSGSLERVTRVPDDESLSDWQFSWRGVRLGWRARDLERVEGRRISWESVTGLSHSGIVDFADDHLENDASGSKNDGTLLTMTIDYDVASLLAVLMESSMVSAFVEAAIASDLRQFRQFALRSYRKHRMKA